MNPTRVLIIDDEPLFCQSLSILLREYGNYETDMVTDPLQALETARSFRPDIVLLDLIMPGMDGGQVRRQLKEDPELYRVPIIFLTASENWTSGMEVETGGDILISKPVTMDRLTKYIEHRLEEVRLAEAASDAHVR